MQQIPVCDVVVYLNDDSNCIYENVNVNEAEIKAISISKTIYCNNRYYNIIDISFNIKNNNLEIFVAD